MATSYIDKAWTMVGGRKFLVWIGTCGMHIAGVVDASSWLLVTLVYLGGQSLIDSLGYFKGTKAGPGPAAKVRSSRPDPDGEADA